MMSVKYMDARRETYSPHLGGKKKGYVTCKSLQSTMLSDMTHGLWMSFMEVH